MTRPLIITMGDPTGVGPEVIIRAVAAGAFSSLAMPLIVVGDLAVLRRAAQVCAVDVSLHENPQQGLADVELLCNGHSLLVRCLSQLAVESLEYGRPDRACGRAMAAYINWACERALAGEAAGMVTAPISKLALQAAGEPFPGHTELLAARCGADNVVMMLAGERLRVCLVTTHCALRDVPTQLTQERILTTLRITAQGLQRQFGLKRPRLAVLSLNPHAGEKGLFGDEEQRLIAPAIAAAQREGLEASGPHSADSLFWFAVQGHYDAVICMYHDQGLIPLKLLHFEDGVNITLGLPIIRTSVDHGTAYDLAGTGKASPTSLIAAVRMAAQMADKSRT